VYLPAGSGWYDFRTGNFCSGGQTIQVEAPYSDIPIFVKAGSIIPFGPAIQYTTEKAANPIRLFVYTGASGSFTLYEDENINSNYEEGGYSLIPLTYDDNVGTLTIGACQGRFAGMIDRRTFEIVWVDVNTPKVLSFEEAPNLSVSYDGNELIIKNEAQLSKRYKGNRLSASPAFSKESQGVCPKTEPVRQKKLTSYLAILKDTDRRR
jgi:alpha-D-xyloside xylohydrolase